MDEGIWEEYRDHETSEARKIEIRNHILVCHQPLMRNVAKTLVGKVRGLPGLDFDDLVSIAVMGCLKAIEKFNPQCGTQFATYAAWRMRGEILDAMRREDWRPRGVRESAAAVEGAVEQLSREHGEGGVSDELLAEKLDWTLERTRIHRHRHLPSLMGLDTVVGYADDGSAITYEDMVWDGRATDPADVAASNDAVESLLCTLRATEREVVTMYCFLEMTMNEISAETGVSESRVSQIYTTAIESLRHKILSNHMIDLDKLFPRQAESKVRRGVEPRAYGTRPTRKTRGQSNR